MAEARERRRRRITGDSIRRRWRLSVRSRIVVSILAVTALGLAASGTASFLVQRERALASVDSQLLHVVPELKVVAQNTGAGAPTSVQAILRAAMQRIVPAENESVLGLVNGTPALVPAATLPYRIDHDPALVKRLISEASTSNVVKGTAKGSIRTLRYLIVPVSATGDTNQGLYVAAYDLDAVLEDVAESFRTYIMVAAIALGLIGLVAWFVSGRLLRPIRLLRQAAAATSTAADLSERIPVTGRDDISELTETINGMFDRLQDAFTSQRRLINDVGHELKTPLTIIRGHLELLDTDDRDEVATTQALALDELDRMSTLVSGITLLAESRTPRFVQLAEADVESLTEAVLRKARALDPARQWSAESAARGIALLDVHRITQAWLQLATNAVKYSTPVGPIVLFTERVEARSGPRLHLGVRDSGPGIPEEAHERIFERFGRLESSRGTDGSGLGLSIVTAIANAHEGTVGLTSSAGTGSSFVIRIPWKAAPEPPEGSEPPEETEPPKERKSPTGTQSPRGEHEQ